MFYRCPVVIHSAQNTIRSTKRDAEFNAQPESCMSPPPAVTADTGEHFIAKGPDPLLLAQGGASSSFPWNRTSRGDPAFCPALQVLLLEPSSLQFCFEANRAKVTWTSMFLAKNMVKKKIDITILGTRETNLLCSSASSSALVDTHI